MKTNPEAARAKRDGKEICGLCRKPYDDHFLYTDRCRADSLQKFTPAVPDVPTTGDSETKFRRLSNIELQDEIDLHNHSFSIVQGEIDPILTARFEVLRSEQQRRLAPPPSSDVGAANVGAWNETGNADHNAKRLAVMFGQSSPFLAEDVEAAGPDTETLLECSRLLFLIWEELEVPEFADKVGKNVAVAAIELLRELRDLRAAQLPATTTESVEIEGQFDRAMFLKMVRFGLIGDKDAIRNYARFLADKTENAYFAQALKDYADENFGNKVKTISITEIKP